MYWSCTYTMRTDHSNKYWSGNEEIKTLGRGTFDTVETDFWTDLVQGGQLLSSEGWSSLSTLLSFFIQRNLHDACRLSHSTHVFDRVTAQLLVCHHHALSYHGAPGAGQGVAGSRRRWSSCSSTRCPRCVSAWARAGRLDGACRPSHIGAPTSFRKRFLTNVMYLISFHHYH